MTESLKFGPEWLRNTVAPAIEGNYNAGATGTAKFPLAEFRYGREEMLSLFDKNFKLPDVYSKYKKLFVDKIQCPLALTACTEDDIEYQRSWSSRPSNPIQSRGKIIPGDKGRGRGRGTFYLTNQFQRSTSLYEDDGRSGIRSERIWADRNGTTETSSDWTGSASVTSPRKESKPSLESWRRGRTDDEPASTDWRSSNFSTRDKWSGRSWRDDDTNADGSGSKPANYNSDQDRPKSMVNATSLRKKSWENEDSLPEWAVEDPVEYGGSFDASGAFHDSENDPDKLFRKEKTSPKTSKERLQNSSEHDYDDKQNFHSDNEVGPIDNMQSLKQNNFEQVEFQGPPDNNGKQNETLLLEPEILHKKDVDRMQEVADDMVAQLIMEDEYGMVGTENIVHGRQPNTALGMPIKPVENVADNWFYEDPQKKIQGPFCATEMAEWYNAGYFDEKLLVKRSCDSRFTSLGDLIQICGGKIPFLASHLIPPIQKSTEPNPASFMSVLARSTSNPAVISNEEIDIKFQLSVLQKQYFLRQQQFILQKLSATEPWNLLTPEQQHELVSHHLAQVSLPDHLLNINEFQNLTQSQIQDLQTQHSSFFGVAPKQTNANFQSMNPLHVPSSMLLPPHPIGLPFNNHDQLNVLNDSNFSRHSGQLPQQMLPGMNMRDMIPQNLPEQQQQQPRAMLPNEITDNNTSEIDPIKSLIMQLSSQKNVGLQMPILPNHPQRAKIPMGPELLRNDIVWNHMSNTAIPQPSNINAFNVMNLQDIENPSAPEPKEKLWEMFHADEQALKAKQKAMQQNSVAHLNHHEKFEDDKVDDSNFNNINQSFDTNSINKPSKPSDRKKGIIVETPPAVKLSKNKKEPDSKSKPNAIKTENEAKKKEEEKRNAKEAINKKRQVEESLRKKLNEEEKIKMHAPKRKESEEVSRHYDETGNKAKGFDNIKANEMKEAQQHFSQQKPFKQNNTKSQDSTVAWSIPNVMPRGMSLIEIEKMERKNRAELEQALKAEQEKPLDIMRNKESIPQWNAAVIQPQTVKSLAEIQAEEHAKQSVLDAYSKQASKQREEKTRLANAAAAASFWGSSNQKTAWNTGKIWGNNNDVNAAGASGTGFWDESMKNSPKQNLKGKTITKSQTVGNIPVQKASFTDNSSAAKKKLLPTQTSPSSSSFVQKANKNENNDPNKNNALALEFNSWCSKMIVSMKANVDVPTFVGFLQDIESPFEVKDYIRIYLGETKDCLDFCKQFLERRSKLKNQQRAQKAHVDDMCSPAPALTPNDFQEVKSKNKGKKVKKNKMTKVDNRILGFSVTSSEHWNLEKSPENNL